MAALVSCCGSQIKTLQNLEAMSLVPHKYTPAEMSAHELESTFAAREHIVDYLLKSLRDQIHSGTLSSFVITGPRGAGKSTIIQMVALRIRRDAELSAAWIPVVFPEEQFNMVSLRDMLAAILHALGKEQIPAAQEWYEKVEAEPNEEQSQQLAVTGLREIVRQTGKRLILFIENLDHLLEQHLDDQMKGTLRRLLMTEPVMMIVGSTVHVFDSLKSYDEAFFNYFGQVPLDRLNPEQVSELLRKRAEFDQNEIFLRELPKQQAKVRTLVHLTGGNPRFVLMLYELLSLQKITSIVQYLRRLVDELTPLLKDEMEHLPPQQRKIIHALMEKGGTAQPTDLVGPTRLPLNAINTQLKRLKDAQIVEVRGGGKGRVANYTVPDKLFSIWYQIRYLSQNRRRIELFVEVLRIWFAEEERVQTLRQLVERVQAGAPHILRECATTAEHLAASLKGTIHEQLATELCIDSWVKADLREAAFAYADLSQANVSTKIPDDATAHTDLAMWLGKHGDLEKAVEALDRILAGAQPYKINHLESLILRGLLRDLLGDTERATADFETVIAFKNSPPGWVALALSYRGMVKAKLGDKQGAIVDLTEAIAFDALPKRSSVDALAKRGWLKVTLGDLQGGIVDCDKAIATEGAPATEIARALGTRAFAKWQLGDTKGALADSEQVIHLDGASKEEVAKILFLRATNSVREENISEAIMDFVKILDLGEVNTEIIAVSSSAAFGLLLLQHNEYQANHVLTQFTSILNSLTSEVGREVAVRFLNNLVFLTSKDEWAKAARNLAAQLKPEVAEAVKFLEPVCSVLEGKDRTLLDALPPEQREFALEVLAKFEPKPKPEPAKAQNKSYSKRVRSK